MATYYLRDADISTGVLEEISTAAPSTLDEAQGWTVGNKKSSNYCTYYPDTVRALTDFTTSEPTTFSQYGYRTPATLKGVFSTGNWVLTFNQGKMQCLFFSNRLCKIQVMAQ
jgi:hypothetical protein